MNLAKLTRAFTLLAAISLLAACAAASDSKRMPTENSLLWKISGKGLDQPSYLFGTIHAIGESDFVMREEVKNAFAETKRLVMEVKLDDPSVQQTMVKKMIMPNDQSLSDMLSVEDYGKLTAFMTEKAGMPELMYNKVKPMFVQSYIYPAMIGETVKSYETTLQGMATDAGMQTYGLETVDEQLYYVDQISFDDQLSMLMQTVNDYDGQVREFDEMVKLYTDEDIAGLSSMISDESKEYKKFEKQLLGQRNKNWISRIDKLVNEDPTFIAVGAGHLGGKGGVISLLRKDGYTLTAVVK